MEQHTRESSDHLHQFLAHRDEECPLCHYNLRGLQSDHCPECGKKLILRIGLEDPVLTAYIAGIVGLAAFFGFAALTLLWFIALTIIDGPGPPGGVWVMILVQAVVSAILLSAWVRSGSRIRRLQPDLRGLLAVLCCAAPIVGVILFTVVIVSSF